MPEPNFKDFARKLYTRDVEHLVEKPKEAEPPKEGIRVKAKVKAKPLPKPERPHPYLDLRTRPLTDAKQRLKGLASVQVPRRCASFQASLDLAKHLHPLPREIQLSQKPEHHTWLMARVGRCASSKELKDLAFSLDDRDLATLFPSLASLKRGEAIDRIISIILMRASKTLYIHGWVTLQYAYPRSTVQQGLSELCEALEQKPERQVQDLPYPLGFERFDWAHIRPISEITLPRNRHFLRNIVKYIKDHELSGDAFFERFGIYRDLPLGLAIRSQWDMAMFESHVENLYNSRRFFEQG